ncbi:sterile alpha motif domain-containing protein 9-like isoform X4 [Acanthopagrus latus]|uniref:sterile alpha motif domain-containing protein 9-like isoform X4 n=1 Tax=Acanthopagrus latus TaxID=8177 RepID=UPI00187C8B4D|nr:sterile alpha motif domain-containing protein 9-like isoform X4 [Acanthopagrus latus]
MESSSAETTAGDDSTLTPSSSIEDTSADAAGPSSCQHQADTTSAPVAARDDSTSTPGSATEDNSTAAGWQDLSCDRWTESHVGSWLRSIGIKEKYIAKLEEEEVTGPVLPSLQRNYLSSTIGMKGGQIELLLKKRDELLMPEQNKPKKGKRNETKEKVHLERDPANPSEKPSDCAEREDRPMECNKTSTSTGETLSFCDYANVDQQGKNCSYVKHNVLPPETGTENLIVPCHEYKSLEFSHDLDSIRLKSKVAKDLLKFACACMNMRTNGTIHFGIMDKNTGTHQHGEIVGFPDKRREDFVDALDYIESSFKDTNQQVDARKCIRNPRFIEVLDKEATENMEKTCVIEYDIVPKATIVKNKLYSVGIPKFSEERKKVIYEKKVPYHRVGANTPSIPDDDLVPFIQQLSKKDEQREEAESSSNRTAVDCREDQKRKLCILLTCGKTHMDDSLHYIIVTNKFQPQHLDSIQFLLHMDICCVFDFDPDSKTSGLCGKYKEQKAVTLHFLGDYENKNGLKTAEFIHSLKLFEKTSWIFCNGRKDFPSGEETCDEKMWIKTKKKKLKKAVSLICNDVLPRGSFVVLFLLMSDVEQPLVETFHEFYAEMNGHDYLAVISESKENYKKWSSLAQVSCHMSELHNISIAGMPLTHVDATVQSIQLLKNQPERTLPVFNGAVCSIKSVEESMLDSLEIISVDQCDETKVDIMSEDEIKQTEMYFYRGGKIDWINFWLADKQRCGNIIKRVAYEDTSKILDRIANCAKAIRPIESVNIYHHPGSGGSTVARQILWCWKEKIRCAVVKQGKEITTVCEHAVKLREHDERDKNNCLPVLLLLEDCKADYIDDLRRELGNVITTKKISPSVLCFILLICSRSNDPERMCRASPSQTVAVTHELKDAEKPLFSKKREELKLQIDTKHILTFVLMSEGFQPSYIQDFVKNTLTDIDHSSSVTRLIRFVALLNSYVGDSYISVSHCEASFGITTHDRARYHAFVNHLSDEAKLLFIHHREASTHISSIRIIHELVAKEILSQLSANYPQSDIAMDLINDKVLMNHRFGRDDFLMFIRALFIRRYKKSRGDPVDSAFSPLIEHVITERDGLQKAVELMKTAYIALGKEAYVAQQLARLLYTHLRFEEALEWAEEAKSLLPFDIFVLDTLAQVYKWWFYHLYDSLEGNISPKEASEIISTALKGISSFRASEKTPKKETVILNSSYQGEVDVGCRLLKFLSEVDVFLTDTGKSKLLKYLLTDYIPSEVKEPWQRFHQQLKGLRESLDHALECISEDLSYFQTEISEEDEELDARDPEQVYNPRKWLTRKTAVYATFFCDISDNSDQTAEHNSTNTAGPAETLPQFKRQMEIYKLGGGNFTSILSLLYDKNTERAGKKLETIIGMYPENLKRKCLDQRELSNFIICQIALNCTLPGSSKLLSLEKLQDLSQRFTTKGRNMSTASALFLLSLLFWPEAGDELSSTNTEILSSAVDALQKLCWQKSQDVSKGKSKIVTHFFLAKAKGLNKIVHRTAIEKHIKGPLSERKVKWLGGEVWKTREVVQLLERVKGWTENGNLFVKGGSRDSKIRVFPRYSASLPDGNERVTFYLGFSFDGVLAYDIKAVE